MATFSTLAADADYIRQGNNDALGEYNDTQLVALNKEYAKRQLKQDLIEALKLEEDDTGDMTNLDSIVDKYETELQFALAHYQLYLFYYENNTGPETLNYYRMKESKARYNDRKARFTGYKLDDYEVSKQVMISRG